ncbi:von Willebrand factor A domain-containing protein 5A isoform X2 [Nematostella vectensis]|uniref:von Willebrand factor A domain-containing protein 5A isoform X2 n=1 Tax=Nematostella vectensis TaxID=45351 RepID=UPI002076DB35|nr:von Willebrand factor A domain-containing protein 5A isoform X2 [Nematostella vectensis]
MSNYGLLDKAVGSSVPLESVWIRAVIRGFTAHVLATLEYKNNSSNPLDAIYVFPVDDHAAICGFQATIDGRSVVAAVQDRGEVLQQNIDSARSTQNGLAVNIDDNADNFQIGVGILPSYKTAVLQVTYVAELPVGKDGQVVFILPSVINPRVFQEHDARKKNLGRRTASVNSKYSFELDLKVQSATSIQEITSPCGGLEYEINASDKRQASVRLTGESYHFNDDVQVNVIRSEPFQLHALTENGVTTKSSDKFLATPIVMLNYFPEFTDCKERTRGEFIFLVDRSKNMKGENIDRAREVLLLFLKSLPDGCHFNVISYGASYIKLFTQSEVCDHSSRERASDFVWDLKAGIDNARPIDPLREVYSHNLIDTGYPRQVFLVTGGEVGNAEQVTDEVRKNAHTARCFTLGINVGKHSDHVRRIARAGRGTCELVSQLDRVAPKVQSMWDEATQPVVTNFHVSWTLPDGWVARCIPYNLPPIYRGHTLILYGLLMREDNKQPSYIVAVEGKATISASIQHGDTTKDVHQEVRFSALSGNPVDRDIFLHRLTAKALIEEEEDKRVWNLTSGGLATRAPIVSLSKSTNIISKSTTFVAVDKSTHEVIAVPELKAQVESFTQSAPEGRIFGLKAVNMKIPIPDEADGIIVPSSPVFISETSPRVKTPSSAPLPHSSTRTVGFTYKLDGSITSPTSPPTKQIAISSNAPKVRQEVELSRPAQVTSTSNINIQQFNFAQPVSPTLTNPPTACQEIPGPAAQLAASQAVKEVNFSPQAPVSPSQPVISRSEMYIEGSPKQETIDAITFEIPMDPSASVVNGTPGLPSGVLSPPVYGKTFRLNGYNEKSPKVSPPPVKPKSYSPEARSCGSERQPETPVAPAKQSQMRFNSEAPLAPQYRYESPSEPRYSPRTPPETRCSPGAPSETRYNREMPSEPTYSPGVLLEARYSPEAPAQPSSGASTSPPVKPKPNSYSPSQRSPLSEPPVNSTVGSLNYAQASQANMDLKDSFPPAPSSFHESSKTSPSRLNETANSYQADQEDGVPPEFKEERLAMLEILSLQQPSAAWPLDYLLADVCGIPLSELRRSCPRAITMDTVTMDTAWATALALACLHVKFSHLQSEWDAEARAGSKWMSTTLAAGGLDFQEIMDKAATMIEDTFMSSML